MGKKIIRSGINDLASQFPEIAKEADGWEPSNMHAGCHQSAKWKCKEGHSWEACVNKRTVRGQGCPYCSGRRVITGLNDLKTKFPELAVEADGWDPSKEKAFSNKKFGWKCSKGHSWTATIANRANGRGCPFCSNRKVKVGFNDLKSQYPLIAAEADNWDPETITPGSNKLMPWKCIQYEHSWETRVVDRTRKGYGCPACSGQKLEVGFNDLLTLFPIVAAEADGWDPGEISGGARETKSWVCSKGHQWEGAVFSRTKAGSGCPFCSNRKVIKGENDLASQFPDIAMEADGWNPSEVVFGSNKKMKWKCSLGHKWENMVVFRTQRNQNCPYCSGQKLMTGFNDLKTNYPEIAAEADGWNPSEVHFGAEIKRKFICSKGHQWVTLVSSRTRSKTGCPSCADHGFNPLKPSWFYLMARPGEQQLGITNDWKTRRNFHQNKGWEVIDIVGPISGNDALATETLFKRWLSKSIGLIDGTRENWSTISLEVNSLKELKSRSGIVTQIF